MCSATLIFDRLHNNTFFMKKTILFILFCICQIGAFAQINDTIYTYSRRLCLKHDDKINEVFVTVIKPYLQYNPKCYKSKVTRKKWAKKSKVIKLLKAYKTERLGADMYQAAEYYMEKNNLTTLDLNDESFETSIIEYLSKAINEWVRVDAIVISDGVRFLPEGRLKENINSEYDKRIAFEKTYLDYEKYREENISEKIPKLLEISCLFDADELKLKLINKADSANIASSYFKKRYYKDFETLLEMSFSEYLTIAVVDSLIADFGIPEVKQALIKEKEICKKWSSIDGKKLYESFDSIYNGGTATPLALAENIDTTYFRACNKMFEEQIKPNRMLRANYILESSTDSELKAAAQRGIQYLDENMPIAFANQCIEVLSIEDIDILNRLYTKSSYKEYVVCQTEILTSDITIDLLLYGGMLYTMKKEIWIDLLLDLFLDLSF